MSRSFLRALPFVLLAGVALATVLSSRGQETRRGETYALLIGVGVYESPALRKLNYSEPDVTALAKVLESNGVRRSNIVVMTNSNAVGNPRFLPSASKVRKELAAFLKLPEPEDTLVIALAGHGVQFKDDAKHYFCPVDADLTNTDTLISIPELYKAADGSKAKFKLMLVDACRDDPLTKKAPRSVVDKVPDSLTRPVLPDPPGGTYAFFSCSRNQEALENPDLGHGVFFHFVLEGMRGKARDREGQVTVDGLKRYVTREVKSYVYHHHGGASQVPELLSKERGDETLLLALAPKKDNESSLGMKFVTVPAGTFWMGGGDGKPGEKSVRVEEFQIGTHEVTQGQWEELMKDEAVFRDNPPYFSQRGEYKDRVKDIKDADLAQFPVENVSWDDITKVYLPKVNAREKGSGWTYRLPSEAEWEYACRGGATSKEDCSYHFYFDDKLTNDLGADRANFDGNYPDGKAPKGRYLERTAKIGSYRPNKLGIYDMHGNVWEWCQDLYSDGASDRVLRGGSWFSGGGFCRASNRYRLEPAIRLNDVGFRLVRVSSR